MKKTCSVAILAAGKGTRLKLPVAKALAPIMGETLVDFVLKPLLDLDDQLNIGFVLGHKKEYVEKHLIKNYQDEFIYTHQEVQNGTGHALQCFLEQYPDAYNNNYLLVTCADTPLLTKDVFETLFSKIENHDALVLSFETQKPFGYGRVKKFEKGLRIVEEKDCDSMEKEIKEVNSGVYLFKTSYLKKHLSSLNNENASGEFYITDLFKESENVDSIVYKDQSIFLGVNDATQLETARKILQKRKIRQLQQKGVFFVAPETCYIDYSVEVGEGSRIEPNVFLKGNSKIGKNSLIENGVVINNSIIADSVHVKSYSYFEDSSIKSDAVIGPFARLRPGAELHEETKVGNFVEVKKSVLKKGSKVSHLSYVGDSEIGERSNIGCGFISCNYDGANKHKTTIGDDCFVGSDCQTIAPVTIESNSFIAAGSTITKNVPKDSFAIARSKQVTKEGRAKQFIKKKK